MDFHELHAQKVEEIKEKYADVINDLATKYNVPVGEGLNRLEAIAYANLMGKIVLYASDIEYDLVELIRDYAELRYYSNNCK